ncbi:MAG TPA: hypothetical protein PKH09_11120, partial [Parvularculaceae bacterium]|nr:hypothetical protein [Parvularculaceae bacterium]
MTSEAFASRPIVTGLFSDFSILPLEPTVAVDIRLGSAAEQWRAGMAGCACEDNKIDADQFDGRSPAYRRALIAVIAINAAMFLVEMSAGFLGSSQALKADALDFAGDTATYALSFAVIGAALRTRA